MKPTPGFRMLYFLDGSKVGVRGLTDVLAAVYAEGKSADGDTAEEIVERLTAKNFIPASARHEYRIAVLDEYKKYLEDLQ